ncbi:MAG TPA: hypothetical protein VML55_07420, partial [Planctomycetaceae bacterium]|nr:hypothetical protein [Planctomycetaceae bacterium]
MSTDTARPGTAGSRASHADAGPQPAVVFAGLDEQPAAGPPGNDPEPAADAAPPAWFRNPAAPAARVAPPPLPKRAAAASGAPARAKLRIEAAPDDEQPLPPRERLKRWLLGAPGRSYGASLAFHAALLVVMALIVYHSMPTNERGTLRIDTREDDDISLDELDTRIDMPLANDDLAPPQLQAVPLPETDADFELQANLDDMLPALGAAGEGAGGGTGLALPRGVNAVTKGSFTAWTVPEDPQPAQVYIIVIEIEVPERVKNYRLLDLSGIVIGTDLYTQQIPFDPRNPSSTRTVRDGKPVTLRDLRATLPVHEGRVQLVIEVPGAAELVRDTIKVRSKLLKEEQ